MYSKYMFKHIPLILATIILLVAHQGCSIPSPEASSYSSQKFCTLPPGVSGSPQNIEQAVALINALPKPVTVSCFLSSLDRPLKVSLTNNTLSAQPAAGNRSPRIFIMIGDLFISVVPDGPGAKVVEFSLLTSVDTSIKAELEFPVQSDLPFDAPYSRIRYQNGTACSACHTNEQRVQSITFAEAFSSTAFQPKPETKVDLNYFRAQGAQCNSTAEPERCGILKAFFGFGEVQHQNFPSGMPFAFSF